MGKNKSQANELQIKLEIQLDDENVAILVIKEEDDPKKTVDKFCKENGIYLIEDAAEAHGQQQMGQLCGSFGDISTFSFYANKHVTTGEGGLVVTDSTETYKKLVQMRNLDFTKERFKHENFYWNYRLSGLQASLGISQLKNLDNVIKFTF